jgi:hypothetical protein
MHGFVHETRRERIETGQVQHTQHNDRHPSAEVSAGVGDPAPAHPFVSRLDRTPPSPGRHRRRRPVQPSPGSGWITRIGTGRAVALTDTGRNALQSISASQPASRARYPGIRPDSHGGPFPRGSCNPCLEAIILMFTALARRLRCALFGLVKPDSGATSPASQASRAPTQGSSALSARRDRLRSGPRLGRLIMTVVLRP